MATSAAASGGPASNGLFVAPASGAPPAGNRKKQKRRAKQAARQGPDDPQSELAGATRSSHVAQGPGHAQPELDYDEPEYDDQGRYDQQGDYYSDDDDDEFLYEASAQAANGAYADHALPPVSKRKSKKKRRSVPYPTDPTSLLNTALSQVPLPGHLPPAMSRTTLQAVRNSARQDRIWNTSTQEERERIKEFWLELSEDARKSLLKIEKEAVLRKMKEQQKHSCSCTVCGRKRTAIEEELEVLYDAYYEELETYANHQHGEEGAPPPRHALPPPRASVMPPPLNTGHHHHRTSRVHEIIDDDDEPLSEDEEEYSDEEDEMYSDEEEPDDEVPQGIGADFFNFGNSLTVKGGILTVADDLLKNDGKKFIEMMEQLAERRMQREQEAEYAATRPTHYPPNGHEPPLDDEDYDDEEEDYDSQDEYDEEEEEDEMGGMTEEQRMEEGRRMFQIFAARMFEQRVLTAYREKVAAERQQKLLDELEDESRQDAQREAKKARDAEKKKGKKLAQKQAKAEEKAKKDAEKAAEEAAARAVEEKKQEEQRKRKEDQRRKKEAEKKSQDEERQRKEMERVKRQQDERDRHAETERKAREVKVLEKRQKDEAKKKEREDREVKEKEIRDRKVQEEKERQERQIKVREDRPPAPQAPQIAKRPSQIAVPPGLQQKASIPNIPSPHVPVATPAILKAPTPARMRQSSQQGPHGSSPKDTSASLSKSTSPGTTTPKTILQNPQKQQHPTMHHPQPNSPITQLPPPPSLPSSLPSGLPGPSQNVGPLHSAGFNNMPAGFSTFHGQYHPMHGMNQRQPMAGFPQQAPIGSQYRGFPPSQPPPGMNGLGMMSQGRGFPMDGPPGFQQHNMPPVIAPSAAPGFGVTTMPSHSRQQSVTEKAELGHSTHPSSRPAPIQRPSSVKPHESGDVDDLNKHLGSSALLDDADDLLPPSNAEARRQSSARQASNSLGFSFNAAPRQSRVEPGSWNAPNMFGPPGLNTPSWGGNLTSNSNAWASNNAFGSLPRGAGGINRPREVRLAVCQACKQLSKKPGGSDTAYHDVQLVVRQIEANRDLASTPSLKEIEDICETEGDAHNGGGMLHVRHAGEWPGAGAYAIMFEPDSGVVGARVQPSALGEIGSPIPSHSMPAFGRGFGGFGGIASPGF